ncbi:IS66 family insertion sequence element accessory protein TnpB [Desemzia incerta]|uniref:IS66 family insertion sequence element accessory protein TnpB n=2 Tax=Carnobacteriaceae TaxID=186828 RepID=UPI0024C3D880|nr:IS66 family insertion sequence element accessory protein TnpB [Desemzia incerta]WHZ32784.1 IS66 family insertion sequence element accessory protein TnpB [Desemzia incerta]WHZ32880.1 IS66 family insertion sequence element accessory protein TnpB [Desemzia incerta]
MLIDYSKVDQIYIVCGKTDMRKSIDGLASIIQNQYNMDVFGNCLFLFCGGSRNKYKALYWEGDGFILLYKRLENGVIQWPRTKEEVRNISQQELRWLLEGLSIEQPKAIKKVKPGHFQ